MPVYEWHYELPHCWGRYYCACNGLHQSPIDISTADLANVGEDNFIHVSSYHPVLGVSVRNNGHNLQITATGQLGYVSIGNHHYFANQFHVHMPSEHSIDGRQSFAELHIVHQKQHSINYDNLLVVAILFDIGEEDNPLLEQMHLSDGPPEEGESASVEDPVNLMLALGPALHQPFYRYNGSLTTPPCTESVKWFVFATPLVVSTSQWYKFKALFPNPGNNRPVQPLNDRRIVENSFEAYEETLPQFDWDFYLSYTKGRNREILGVWTTVLPLGGIIVITVAVMMATFFRGGETSSAFRVLPHHGAIVGGLANTIGRRSRERFRDDDLI